MFFGILKRHKRDKIQGKVGLKIMKKRGETKLQNMWKHQNKPCIDALHFFELMHETTSFFYIYQNLSFYLLIIFTFAHWSLNVGAF